MTKLLCPDIVQALSQFRYLYVGLSGGMDSVVLLHCLQDEVLLKDKVVAVHVNHQLQPQSKEWQIFSQQLCHQWNIPYLSRTVQIKGKSNLEAKARDARYAQFSEILDKRDALLTAHHADDQVETFLLNLFRGSGLDGLSAIPVHQSFAKGQLWRPLLTVNQAQIEGYANLNHLTWVEDPSNLDCRFRRNWLRHELLPMIHQKWPSANQSIIHSVQHIQQANHFLQSTIAPLMEECIDIDGCLQINLLNQYPLEKRYLVIRQWLKSHNLSMPTKTQLQVIIDEVIEAKQDATPVWQLGGQEVRRFQQRLYVCDIAKNITLPESIVWTNFPEPIRIAEIGQVLRPIIAGTLPEIQTVNVRFRIGGEKFIWRGKTRVVKKLLQNWQIPPWERDTLPFVYIDDELVAIGRYAVSDGWQSSLLAIKMDGDILNGL